MKCHQQRKSCPGEPAYPRPAVSRRSFLGAGLAAVASSAGVPAQPPTADTASFGPLEIDLRKLVSRADLHYARPVERSEEGIPVGNGRTGSLVWTSPTALRFQINRTDVYPVNSATNSFFERHSDYCGGCAFAAIDFAETGPDVFPETGCRQHLSVYDGLLTVEGQGLTARIFAWMDKDVIAVEVTDRRQQPEAVSASLRMLRYASQYFGRRLEDMVRERTVTVQTRNHLASSRLMERGGRILLLQEFREGSHVNKTAVAIGAFGRPARVKFASETEVRLACRPGAGTFTFFIASASSFDPEADVAEAALSALEEASRRGFGQLLVANQAWWREFWRRGFVCLDSTDESASAVAMNYCYFLYLMASSSRGLYPPKFNGMLWNTGGDLRTWGAQHWFANLSCYYEALPAANRWELMEPVFRMYSGMREACAKAAKQQWGSQGIFIPETVWHDGLAELPEEIAREMRELYLLRKPWEQRSVRFLEFASTKHPHSSRWNWIGGGSWVDGRWVIQERGEGPYGPVTHILGTTAKVAYLYWRKYEYTQDAGWLRERAYPMLRDAAEFYRNFPNLKKGPDGKYHIHHVNSNESVWGARDTDEDLSALRGLLPAAIRASEVLQEDAELRAHWRELLENLALLPTSAHPDALRPGDYQGPEVFVRGLHPVVRSQGFLPDVNSLPMWFFDLCGIESADRARLTVAQATFDAYTRNGVGPQTPVGVLSKLAIAAAALGRRQAVRHLIPNQIEVLRQERDTAYRGGGRLANRMTLREGPQALDAQSLGRAAEALHLALLQSAPAEPAGEPILHLFPALPESWDAAFRLLARGALLVTSSCRSGRVEFVHLEPMADAGCRMRNPWGEVAVDVYRNGERAESLQGPLLAFSVAKGEPILLAPSGTNPDSLRRRLPG